MTPTRCIGQSGVGTRYEKACGKVVENIVFVFADAT